MAPRRSKRDLEVERLVKRVLDRVHRIERIQGIYYEELLSNRPPTFLPVPPLCVWPLGKREWERAYRTWRDAVIGMVEQDRELKQIESNP